jgi:hypothetical protein
MDDTHLEFHADAERCRLRAENAALHARVQELGQMARDVNSRRVVEMEAQLASIGAGGVSGPLIGQPQAMPDLTAMTERGAKAWAGVDAQGLREIFTAADMATAAAQGFRDGVASVAASAGEPMFWVRLCGDGLYEGPIHNARIEEVRKQSGVWSPLYLAAPPTAQAEGWTKPHRTVTYVCPVCCASLERQE